ncbi:protein phosphatase 2C domain-containing protein [Rossellomorea aquimaris]|uniref:protein phosphatase 2C domain-containing protein n=1 Tax=Rossellomorea aquimaris TaxID=189382 RepID=UPI001CD636CE|nr:protein phosphatase 2C domain-containing protein [Rossellomorea aquimaris]MCA1055775.1 protein phosphatase 2C domain-containing protein [Rossellomorea aquimaris]
MKINHMTIKGDGWLNEDALIINEHQSIFGVADGVSSLVDFRSKENLTGGFLASHTAKDYFESGLRDEENLYDAARTINHTLNMKMQESGIDLGKKEQLWGTALAVVKISRHGIEYIQTGDCMIVAVYRTGEVRPLTRLQVEHLEVKAVNKWKACINEGMQTRAEIMPEVKPIILENRQQSNTEGGYGVLNGEPEASHYFEWGKINRTGLTHLILFTDGLLLPSGDVPPNTSYWNWVAKEIVEKGIRQYAMDLLVLEDSDSECISYPRFKKSDDKAGIVIEF